MQINIIGALIVLVILALIYSIICKIYNYDKYLRIVNYSNYISPAIIKTLQEIACDYRVRVIKAGKGSFEAVRDRGCIILGNENNRPGYHFEFDDNSELYLINFRVFGKCYLAYSRNEVDSWSMVVGKAREESRNLFGRSGYLDRHKIQ